MKKQADTTTDMNHEQAGIDFVVTPNSADDEDMWGDIATIEPKPQSKPSEDMWGDIAPIDTSGRGTDPVPRGVPTDEAVQEPGFSQIAPGEAAKLEPTPEEKSLESITSPDESVRSFQQLFTSMGTWQGEADGKMNPKLADLGRAIERQIANKIGNQSVIGMIVSPDGSRFTTTVEDVRDALKLIEGRKAAKSTMDDRLVSFANIMLGKK